MAARCNFWLPKKNKISLRNSRFCGNHTQRSDGQWVPCPIHPSHSVLEENLQSHLKRCPFYKQAQSLLLQPFYQKRIKASNEEEEEGEQNFSSEMKRNVVHAMTLFEFSQLINKIKSVHASICRDTPDSFKIPQACDIWTNRQVDRCSTIGFTISRETCNGILGNLEEFGVLKSCGNAAVSGTVKSEAFGDDDDVPAVVEFEAGRGYLMQVLADCYRIKKILLVERKSYKLKADRSLRQKESVTLERLRIDRNSYLAIGKHLCGPATGHNLMQI